MKQRGLAGGPALLALVLVAASCRAEAAGTPVVESVRPSPAQAGGLVIVQGRGFDDLLSLLVAGRVPARVTPVNDTTLAFVLPEDVPAGATKVDFWFIVGPPLTADLLIAAPSTGTEPPAAPPPPIGASPEPTEIVRPSPPPAPVLSPESRAPVAPGPFILPTVVPVPRTEGEGGQPRGRGNEGNGNSSRGRGNEGESGPGRGRSNANGRDNGRGNGGDD